MFSKEHHVFKKNYIWNPATCSCENGKYLESIIANSVISCDEIMEETKRTLTETVPTKTILLKSSFYILLAFLLTTIALMITVSIFLIKQRAKQKYLLPYDITNNKLKEIFVSII